MSLDVGKFVLLDEQLNTHVLAVLTNQVDEVGALAINAKRVIVGETTVLMFPNGTGKIARQILSDLLENSIAYNYAYFDRTLNSPDAGHTMRYDAHGNQEQVKSYYANEDIKSVVVSVLDSIGLQNELYRTVAHCYAMNTSWDNQEANGKMHQMRKLIGGL